MNLSSLNVIPFKARPDARGRALAPWDRDPRRFPFGLLIVDPWMEEQGASGFCWFASEASAAEFLRHGLWDVLDDERMARFPGVRELYQAALAQRSDISQDWIDAVSALQDHVLVLWFGSFDALLRGDPGIPRAVMEGYQEDGGRPAGLVEVESFIEYVRKYMR